DQVVVEVTQTTPDGDIVYPQGQTATATLSPGHSVTARITMATSATNTFSGKITFSVRIINVLRPDGNGGMMSIYNGSPNDRVTIGGQTNLQPTLTVKP
ncbi:MAG: hypothetical protein ABR563_19450, partial [Pyrinomonadaceae bacterium]